MAHRLSKGRFPTHHLKDTPLQMPRTHIGIKTSHMCRTIQFGKYRRLGINMLEYISFSIAVSEKHPQDWEGYTTENFP